GAWPPVRPRGGWWGARGETRLLACAAAGRAPPPASTGTSSVPRTESCFSRCAIVFASPMSFAATISKSPPCWSWARRKFLPIRPKPLIPTLVFAIVTPPLVGRGPSVVTEDWRAGPGAPETRPPVPHPPQTPRPTLPVPPPLETWRQTGSESAAGRAGTRRGEYASCVVAALGDLQRIPR